MKFSRINHVWYKKNQDADNESAKLAEALHHSGTLEVAGNACVHIASKYYEVWPVGANQATCNMGDQLCFKVFHMNISQPTPQNFINLIMGAWPENNRNLIEILATITSFMCLLDKDLTQFRTSVLAVASLETVINRLTMSPLLDFTD